MGILGYLIKAENGRFSRGIQTMQRAAGTLILLGGVTAGSLLGSSLIVGTDNGSNAFPFGGPFGSNPGTDYQEAYASSDFSTPELITGIDFFEAPGQTGSLYSGTYTLSLSVISSSIGSLSSSNLSSNIGADNTVFETVVLSGKAPAN